MRAALALLVLSTLYAQTPSDIPQQQKSGDKSQTPNGKDLKDPLDEKKEVLEAIPTPRAPSDSSGADRLTVLGIVIGGIMTILVAISVEYLRMPKLQLAIETPPCDVSYQGDRPARHARYLRLKLSNKSLPRFVRWMLRAPALQCSGAITFHHVDGQNVFGRAMPVRWAGSQQPLPIEALTSDGTRIHIFDPMRMSRDSRIDVYPGGSELLDVAARLDDDEEAFGWNNDTYFCPTPWRNPEWKLEKGRYLVKVTVNSSGQQCSQVFRLVNDVPRGDCRLELPQPKDNPA